MKISVFQNAWDNEPKPFECTWESFASQLGPHEYTYTEKKACPLFSPAEYPDGTTRRLAKNVSRLWLYVADLDHLTQQDILTTLERVRAHELAAAVYSTWSHAEDPWRIRIVHPLTRPVLASEWPAFWSTMTQAYGGVADPQCSDASRMYFGAFAPPGTESVNFYHVFDGAAIDVDAVLKQAGKHSNATEDLMRADALRVLGEAWPSERRHEAHLALAGGLLMSGISDGEAVDMLCRVAIAQDPDNEDRNKRESIVAHTRERIEAGERVVGWTTLAGIIGGDVVAQAKAILQAPPKITRNQIELFAKALRKKNDALAELGLALGQVCKGESFAEPSNRSDVIFRLAKQLAERFVDYDAQSIADLFIPSLLLIGLTSMTCPSVDDIAAAILKTQRDLRAKQFAEQQAERDEQATRVREAFKNGRSHPYTKEELESFGPNIAKRWIIQRDKAFYLFFNGSYKGPFSEKDVINSAVRELSPARSAGVHLYSLSDKGKVSFKDIKTLVDEYGTVAESMTVDLGAQRTLYNEYERCIIEAPCQLRPIKPVFHADVDQWLRILCWNNPYYYENLKTWLAVLTRLDFICSALFLTGKKSVGKSMLAQGISRLWTINGPTKLEDAFGSFNDQLVSCPFTFADEYLPKDFRGYTKFEELRAHVQETERPYRRKFLPTSKMLGATRTMIAAHNKTILKTPQTLTDDDISAIIERFFYIPTNPEAAVFLANLRPTTFERGWVSKDVIAEHVLWLRDNHPHQTQGRFYVHVPDETLFRTLSTQSGSKGAVCQWLVSHLLSPEEFHKSAYSNLYVRVKGGKYLVNPRGIMHTWGTYIGQNERCPPIGILSRVVSELSNGQRLKYPDKRGEPVNYRAIEMKNLISWVEDNDFCEPEALLAALQRDTNET